jgi:exodeoxyribonuclease V beta subunit
LQEFAFQAKFLIGFQEDTFQLEEEEGVLLEIKDFLRTGLHPEKYSPSQLQILLAHHAKGGDIQAACEKILSILEKGSEIRTFPTGQELWMRFCDDLKNMPRASQQDLWEEFQALAPKLAKSSKWHMQASCLFQFVEKGQCSYEEWDDLLSEKKLFFEMVRFDPVRKKKDAEKLRYPGLLERLSNSFSPLWKQAKDPQILLLRLARDCQARHERMKEEYAHFQPDDLVKKMQEALQDPCFRAKVQNKYKAAIIDEFQDTDPLQWDIFKTLFLNGDSKPRALYLVGDPKQSIYAFRSADVYTYLEAAKILGDENRFCLDTNYRSHPSLVTSLNELFTFDLAKAWMQLPLAGTCLEVRKVESRAFVPSVLEGDFYGRLHFFIAEESSSGNKYPSEEIEENQLFPFIAEEVQRLSKEKKIQYKQIAILVKDRYQASRLQQYLKRYEIPCLMQKNIEWDMSPAYEGMKDLFGALKHPTSESCLKKVLAGCLIGKTAEEILGGWENALLQKARGYFSEGKTQCKKKGFGAFFQDFLLSQWNNDNTTVIEDLLSREDSSLYFELRQIAQILLENKPGSLYNVDHLYDFLLEMKDLPSDSEALKHFAEEEEDQVVVMTVHKSKGLEFDVVFALGLCYRHSKQEQFVSIKQGLHKILTIVSDAEEAQKWMQQELDAEKMRQLYVALTRARERVYIPAVISASPDSIAEGTASAMELFCMGFGSTEYSLAQAYAHMPSFSLSGLVQHLERLKQRCSISYDILIHKNFRFKQESPPLVELQIPSFPDIVSKDQSLLSFSSLSKEMKSQEVIFTESEMPDRDIQSPHTLPLGVETGTVLHGILEHICKTDLHRDPGRKVEEFIEKACRNTNLEGWENTIFLMIQKTFELQLFDKFCLREIPSADMHVEMEFMYPYDESLLKGFIDLVFRKNGKYYLVDWKTNFLGGSDEEYSIENMKRAMEQHNYFLQADIYVSALKRYLCLFEKKPFHEYFGGVIYLFLRGSKAYCFYPEPSLQRSDLFKEFLCLEV